MERNGLPNVEWVFGPARRFIQYFFETSLILRLCIHGIEQQGKLAHTAAAIAPDVLVGIVERQLAGGATPCTPGNDARKEIDQWMRQSFFASDEACRGFPIIRSHTLVAFWGALEVFVDDLVLCWLANYPDSLKSEGLSKIKVSLSEFERLGKDERLLLLLDEMKRQSKADVSRGVNQFENTLKIVDLGDSVDKRISDDLFITQQLRNVIVHRGSMADRRFVDACPELGFKLGESIVVDEPLYERCRDSIEDYFLCLVGRAVSRLGGEVPAAAELCRLIAEPIKEVLWPTDRWAGSSPIDTCPEETE